MCVIWCISIIRIISNYIWIRIKKKGIHRISVNLVILFPLYYTRTIYCGLNSRLFEQSIKYPFYFHYHLSVCIYILYSN